MEEVSTKCQSAGLGRWGRSTGLVGVAGEEVVRAEGLEGKKGRKSAWEKGRLASSLA